MKSSVECKKKRLPTEIVIKMSVGESSLSRRLGKGIHHVTYHWTSLGT